MQKLLVVAVLLGSACGKGGDKAPPTQPADVHVDFTVDGKPVKVSAADILTTFNASGTTPVFKIFAGAEASPKIVLTIDNAMTGPSRTPSGSKADGSEIRQGSVSLQDFPEKNYTTNSFNTADDTMAIAVPDAVVVTAITADGKDAKIVEGTFHAKTFGSHSKGTPDPKDTDHEVSGTFRVRHEMRGDRF